jgi:hypothetical protein
VGAPLADGADLEGAQAVTGQVARNIESWTIEAPNMDEAAERAYGELQRIDWLDGKARKSS